MAQSITSMARRQQKAVDSGFLDLLGSDINAYQPLKLDSVVDTLYYVAGKFVEIATQKLETSDAIASGSLSSSIKALPMEILGKVYSISINLNDYYKFVDQGVKGWQDERGGNSPYHFKKFTGKSGQKSSKMVSAIREWLVREALQGSGKENAHKAASARSQKRHSITDVSTQAAIVISKVIRKKGLKPTHFWTDTEREMNKLISDEFAASFKIDIINSLSGRK